MIAGFTTAVALHGLYNFSIITAGGNFKTLIPLAILAGLAVFLSFAFNDLKKLKSICKP